MYSNTLKMNNRQVFEVYIMLCIRIVCTCSARESPSITTGGQYICISSNANWIFRLNTHPADQPYRVGGFPLVSARSRPYGLTALSLFHLPQSDSRSSRPSWTSGEYVRVHTYPLPGVWFVLHRSWMSCLKYRLITDFRLLITAISYCSIYGRRTLCGIDE